MGGPTKRAVDVWESAAFSSIFLASSFFCSQAESTPAHTPLTQTVRRGLPKQCQVTLWRVAESVSRGAGGARGREETRAGASAAEWREERIAPRYELQPPYLPKSDNRSNILAGQDLDEELMLRTIAISESIFDLLDREAKRNRLSPNALAERLLAERLSADEQAWREQFENLLARVHARMARFDPNEIEADITAASSEARVKRRARRRTR